MSINSLISSGDITLEELQQLLQENSGLIRAKDAVGFTALHHCARNDRCDLAEHILSLAGEDKKKLILQSGGVTLVTPLHLGAIKGNLNIIKLFMTFMEEVEYREFLSENKDRDGNTVVLLSIIHNHLEMFQYFYELGGCTLLNDVNNEGNNCTILCAIYGHLDIFRFIAAIKKLYPPMNDEIFDEELASCRTITEITPTFSRVNKNKHHLFLRKNDSYDTLLHCAVNHAQLDFLRYVVTKVNYPKIVLILNQMDQQNLLHRACIKGHVDVVKYLLYMTTINHFDKPNPYDNELAKTLISSKDLVNEFTPLHYAAQCSHLGIIREILFLVKSLNILFYENKDKMTPYNTIVSKEGKEELVRYIDEFLEEKRKIEENELTVKLTEEFERRLAEEKSNKPPTGISAKPALVAVKQEDAVELSSKDAVDLGGGPIDQGSS